MLNEYLTIPLLREELIKRDYVFTKIEKDDGWQGGKLIVPFKSQGASSIKFGALTGSTDISQSKYQRGSIDDYVEMWGSLIFNYRDIKDHKGGVSEKTFLNVLPDTIDDYMTYIKEVASIQMSAGPHFALATGDGQAGGTITVDRIDRFQIDQKVTLDDGNSSPGDYYVIAVNVNTDTVTLSATRGGAAANISAYTLAQTAKFYHDGVWDGSTATTFVSIKQSLLSAANGGSSTLYGKTKVDYPFLQAINLDGSTITATNLLDKLFDGYVNVRKKARGNASSILMSYKHLGTVMKLVEIQKGAYKVGEGTTKVSEYGWTEIVIQSLGGKGNLTCVGIQEWDDDIIVYMDWKAVKFASNGLFEKAKSPDGLEYFTVRNTTGYQFIVDICLFGELVFKQPNKCGIYYSISY